ncbi:synaptojanin-1 isoform X2 [Hippocampus comes]|uniref:synaptojanin-1 isoform X2 n=1 Tax=Hippocampus comes TaxID=109280 RepID=UPI00094E3B88|nr:PREDICTED: synaptojanin-1-like isoform X2 [Hippocampus comes]
MWMESYEEFCLRSAAALQEETIFKRATREPIGTYSSVIVSCGKAALSPLLNAEQRQQMCELRRTAAQLEIDRQNQRRGESSARVPNQPAICAAQSRGRAGSGPLPLEKETKNSDKSACEVTPSFPAHTVTKIEAEKSPSPKATTLNGYTVIADWPGLIAGDEVRPGTEEKSDEEDVSTDSLLKPSKEDVKRRPREAVSQEATPAALPQTVSEKETRRPKSGLEFGFSLHRSPVGPPETPFHQNPHDPEPQRPVSPSPPDQFVRQPSPESGFSPRVPRRKPRPFSTGNICIVLPGTPGDGAGPSDRREAPPGAARRPTHGRPVSSQGAGGLDGPGSHRSGHRAESPTRESRSPETPASPVPAGRRADAPSTFRRRCRTMDSQPRTDHTGWDRIDRSRERTPRFMAGVTMRPSSGRSWAAPPYEPFLFEKPSACLRRPPVCPEGELGKAPDDPRRPCHQTSPTFFTHAGDACAGHAEETQRRAQVLEDMQRRLEEAHAFQMSLLLAEQEKEQRRLRLELEETERRLREQERVTLQTRDSCQWKRAPANDGLPAASPSAATAGHRQGFPRPTASNATSPAARPPVRLQGPPCAAHKPQALNAEKQRASCRLGAVARGFLVRRLLKTRKVQHLRQTVTDTQEFIRCFRTEGSQKRSTLSAQDLSLHDRVGAQLRAALYDIHEIFFEIPAGDRLALLQQDRELCAEKKQREEEKAKKEKERAALSAATQRSLDRKKREAESPGQAGKAMPKPKSPTPSRVPKASQVQKCVPSQLNRQGSWYKKTPEARAKCTDNPKNLKKQHSLG